DWTVPANINSYRRCSTSSRVAFLISGEGSFESTLTKCLAKVNPGMGPMTLSLAYSTFSARNVVAIAGSCAGQTCKVPVDHVVETSYVRLSTGRYIRIDEVVFDPAARVKRYVGKCVPGAVGGGAVQGLESYLSTKNPVATVAGILKGAAVGCAQSVGAQVAG